MSKRLQVILGEQELKAIQKKSKLANLTVSDWVRHWIQVGMSSNTPMTPEQKLSRLLQLSQTNAPTADIDQMLKEIEIGRE